MSEGCSNCGLKHQCICDVIPHCNSTLHLSLLMHENELERETNTGQWLLKSLPFCEQYVWQRTEPNKELVMKLNQTELYSMVVYPDEESIPVEEALIFCQQHNKTPHFIVLDGTWQEAKKMKRKSPWLQNIACVSLPTQTLTSHYQLRRNQKPGNLCTLEVAALLMRLQDEDSNADTLESFLHHYSLVLKADKSGHAWQGN